MPLSSRLSLLAALLLAGVFAVVPPRAACSVAPDDGPSITALQAGLAALDKHKGRVRNHRVWTLIDYDLPFTAVRLWVFDRSRGLHVMLSSEVSHAWKSGVLYAARFSNKPGSNLSSVGSYLTARHTYEGSFGHSLRIRGLEPGVNDNAWKRDIVFHPAMATHSLGCFMLPEETSARIIDTIVGGSFVHVHRTPR